MSNETRERDLVLAPNEFAFISDQTKGNINVYVGPYKTSLANTDKPVVFDEKTKRFVICNLETAIQTFVTAPEAWYIVLKNPPMDNKQPKSGTTNSLPELNIGRKVNIPGPISFALWPGQMAKVIKGHHLRSNQYLLVRVYDEQEAQKNWAKSVIKTKEGADDSMLLNNQVNDLSVGKLLIIKGTSVSFYIPPTGVEVVRTETGDYVREAVTLERMEYCILLDENGNKRYVKGPDVVFPEPTEEFVIQDGAKKFKAVELNEISGIYIKVIAPYEENGKSYKEGDELFITGKEQMIYYPRPEHAIIRYGKQDKIHSIAIPKGEGRYYLNRLTGVISLKRGPAMFLPDPRTEVIVRRVLDERKVRLWFPGNEEALQYNLLLKKMSPSSQQMFVEEAHFQQKEQAKVQLKAEEKIATGDSFNRGTTYTPPRTITIDSKYEGAVNISVWNGYAVQVVSKTGERKVLVGPISYLLEYDEDLQTLEFSTGTPKTDENLYRTVYLRIHNNKVSDIVEVETADACPVEISLSFRLNFIGEPEKWFNTENYVKFLVENMRPEIRALVQALTVKDIFSRGTYLLIDYLLGPLTDGKRNGIYFEEIGMHIFDIEVKHIEILDEAISEALIASQQDVLQQNIKIEELKRNLEFAQEKDSIDRVLSEIQNEATLLKLHLQDKEQDAIYQLQTKKIESDKLVEQKRYELEVERQKLLDEAHKANLERNRMAHAEELEYAKNRQVLQIEMLEAQIKELTEKAQAISPDLVAALQSFADKALAEKMAESMAPLAILGGNSVVDVLKKLLKGTKIENVLSNDKPNS